MTTIPRIPAGRIVAEIPCPACGVLEPITVDLTGVLTTPTEEPPSLRVKTRAKPLEHYCHPHGAPAQLFESDLLDASDRG